MTTPGQVAEGQTGASPAQAAWLEYRDMLAAQREALLASAFGQHPLLRAQGLYFLQSQEASAFNIYVAPRPQFPALYVQSFFMPFELSWGMPNPDFLNHNGFIDGAHTYRIWGNCKGGYWSTIQVFRGFWGDDVQGTVANIDFDEIPVSAEGDFEIFLGPNPPVETGGKYWVSLEPEARNMMLAMRETFYDWSRDTPMEIHIECLDRDPGVALYFDEDELARRVARARKWAEFNFNFSFGQAQAAAQGERNVFTGGPGSDANSKQAGGNPLGAWIRMVYDIQPGEALIIEGPVAEARYWGVQLGSVWSQTTDFSYHQSSLNGAQMQVDADGRYRAVLALQDPGVPNWLDPAGVPIGVALLRYYKFEAAPIPEVKKVKLADLRAHLPKETPLVTPQQRSLVIEARRRASLRRYGQ
jgi:hypothetical protein